ncbi:hypothetical protein [Streptomyces sp. NPDC056188]|uniref:hypothetical protein n=1 Tax=Streptomyces sp. NPDC056188 TaxID=3345740 RepID=UPI0035D7796E
MLFVLFALPAALVLAATVIGLVAHAVRRLREGGRPRLASPRPLALGTGFAATSAFLIFSHADLLYSPGMYGDKTCMARMGVRDYPDSHSYFPLSTVCGGVEIVPVWINPAVVALLALAAVTLAALPFAYVVRHSSARPA